MKAAPSDLEWIRSNVYGPSNKLNPRSSSPLWWATRDKQELWDAICAHSSFLSADATYAERMFCFVNQIHDIPLCKTCRESPVKYSKQHKTYQTYCSSRCTGKDPDTAEKRQRTNVDRYGEAKNFSSEAHHDAAKATMTDRYGTPVYSKTDEFKEKSQSTQQSRYGDLYVRTPEYTSKMRQTALDVYGEDSWMKLEKYSSFTRALNQKITPTMSRDIASRYIAGEAKQHIARDLGFSYSHMNKLIGSMGLETNLPQNKINYAQLPVSTGELSLREMVSPNSAYNDRRVIGPLELDIVDYDAKIAYEYNGTYWHSDFFKTPSYHKDKLEAAESQGYRLFTIFSNVYSDRYEVLKSKLMSPIRGPIEYARRMRIDQCEYSEVHDFIDRHHIQGTRKSGINFKAVDPDGNTVAVATFNSFRDGIELVRFASSVKIPGILSKIMKRVESDHIYSFANRCYTYRHHNVYLSNSFEEIDITPPNYFYVKGTATRTRNSSMKHKLESFLPEYDDSASEYENMVRNGYHRVWDCGNILYKLKRQ